MMTVGALISELSNLNPALTVVLASDPEGNDFHTVYEVAEYDGEESFDLLDETRADVAGGSPVVVLWP